MNKLKLLLLLVTVIISCKKESTPQEPLHTLTSWQSYDETTDLAGTQELQNGRMHLKLINSKILDKNEIWAPVVSALEQFPLERYSVLTSLILEKSIPELQQSVKDGKFTYEELTLFYCYRIYKYEQDNKKQLNGIIAINPNVIERARELDKIDKSTIDIYSVYGMPILLKDNVGAVHMHTTAGAIALKDNNAPDAFITQRLKDENAIILGKANLSEWAYYLCTGCPVGYSAVGGQTINPYGRLRFESGGSSSGSGVTVAANYAVAAIGTETAGSILSPSSQNSVVGLKPTIGVLSRSGIVPISSTLDTPGPMTKNVIDNAIMMDVLIGYDQNDPVSKKIDKQYIQGVKEASILGKRFGVIKAFLQDTLYQQATLTIEKAGGVLVEITPEQLPLPGFLTLLNIDMKNDLPAYLKANASSNIIITDIASAVAFNKQDTLVNVPYGQQLFEGIVNDSTTTDAFIDIKRNLEETGRRYFDVSMDTHELDAVLSINNFHAAYAAVAKYPALTVPMGYTDEGEPEGLTFIGKPLSEKLLLQLAVEYEKVSKQRKLPEAYLD